MPAFIDPPWDKPLDVESQLRAIPREAVIKGMFPSSIAFEAKRRGLVLRNASDKYLAFLDYPLVDHVNLLVEAGAAFYPELTLRQSLRKIGRSAMIAFTQSTIGKTVVAGFLTPDTIPQALGALSRAFAIAINKPTPRLEVLEVSGSSCVLRMTDFWIFVDSHLIGIIEGLFKMCSVRGEVRVAITGPASGELSCKWSEAGPQSSG